MSYRLVERALGNVRDFAVGTRRLEVVPIASEQMARRLVRLATSDGDLGIVLDGGERLRDGDVVFADDARVVVVAVRAEEVLVVAPRSIAEAAQTAHAIGNRHIPMQVDGATLVVPADPALETFLSESGVPLERTARVLDRPFLHAHAPHNHTP